MVSCSAHREGSREEGEKRRGEETVQCLTAGTEDTEGGSETAGASHSG